MKILFISDLHFNHNKIIEYEHRPYNNIQEMNEDYIRIWNNKVQKGDIVYVLGDFCISKSVEETDAILSRLNGQKFLIKGNHDHSEVYKAKGWTNVYDYLEKTIDGKRVVMFHYPIAVWADKHHGSKHLYGHVHSNTETHHPMTYNLGKAYNVGIDVLGEPKTLDEILEFYGANID